MTKIIKQSEPAEIIDLKNICETMANKNTITSSHKVTKETIQSFKDDVNHPYQEKQEKQEDQDKKNKQLDDTLDDRECFQT